MNEVVKLLKYLSAKVCAHILRGAKGGNASEAGS